MGVKTCLVSGENIEKLTKPSDKLSRIDRYEHVERSMRVFISNVMNMWNGRYETIISMVFTIFSMAFHDFLKGLTRLSQWFFTIVSMVLCYEKVVCC